MSPLAALAGAPSLDLQHGETDVWMFDLDAQPAADPLDGLAHLLTEDEQRRMQRFRFAADRARCGVARLALRLVLARYAPLAPASWRFAVGAHGRPRVDVADPRAAGLDFSVAHSGDAILLGVQRAGRIGVDTELARDDIEILALADRNFSPAEALRVRAAPDTALRRRAFFETWCLKESYVKATGLGLSAPLRDFSILPAAPAELPGLRTHASTVDPLPARWHFVPFEPRAGYLGAVCADRNGSRAPRLRWWCHRRARDVIGGAGAWESSAEPPAVPTPATA